MKIYFRNSVLLPVSFGLGLLPMMTLSFALTLFDTNRSLLSNLYLVSFPVQPVFLIAQLSDLDCHSTLERNIIDNLNAKFKNPIA